MLISMLNLKINKIKQYKLVPRRKKQIIIATRNTEIVRYRGKAGTNEITKAIIIFHITFCNSTEGRKMVQQRHRGKSILRVQPRKEK